MKNRKNYRVSPFFCCLTFININMLKCTAGSIVKTPSPECSSREDANSADSLDFVFGQFAEKFGLNDDRLFGKSSFA